MEGELAFLLSLLLLGKEKKNEDGSACCFLLDNDICPDLAYEVRCEESRVFFFFCINVSSRFGDSNVMGFFPLRFLRARER